MDDQVLTQAQLITELTQLRKRVAELETPQATRGDKDPSLLLEASIIQSDA